MVEAAGFSFLATFGFAVPLFGGTSGVVVAAAAWKAAAFVFWPLLNLDQPITATVTAAASISTPFTAPDELSAFAGR